MRFMTSTDCHNVRIEPDHTEPLIQIQTKTYDHIDKFSLKPRVPTNRPVTIIKQ